MKANSRVLSILMCSLLLATAVAFCQTQPSQGPAPGPPPGLPSNSQPPGVVGTIAAIDGKSLTIKTQRGETATVQVTSETRFRRDRNEAQLGDFKIGETVVIVGARSEGGTWNARFVATRSETSKEEPGDGLLGGKPPAPPDVGKSFIIGRLTKIENMKLTIQCPDGANRVIEVDDKTKFLDGHGETIKLADFQTGDQVGGSGALKNGVFVATEFRKAPADLSAPPPLPPPPPPLPF